jgi:hypothetical protein
MQLLGAATAAPRRSVARGGRAQLIEWSVGRTGDSAMSVADDHACRLCDFETCEAARADFYFARLSGSILFGVRAERHG